MNSFLPCVWLREDWCGTLVRGWGELPSFIEKWNPLGGRERYWILLMLIFDTLSRVGNRSTRICYIYSRNMVLEL